MTAPTLALLCAAFCFVAGIAIIILEERHSRAKSVSPSFAIVYVSGCLVLFGVVLGLIALLIPEALTAVPSP